MDLSVMDSIKLGRVSVGKMSIMGGGMDGRLVLDGGIRAHLRAQAKRLQPKARAQKSHCIPTVTPPCAACSATEVLPLRISAKSSVPALERTDARYMNSRSTRRLPQRTAYMACCHTVTAAMK